MSISARRLSQLGRALYGLSAFAFGVLNFVFSDFVAGRAPAWAGGVFGQFVWADVTGFLFIGSGLAIIVSKRAREAGLLIGTLVLAWAFLRSVPLLVADPSAAMLTGTGKALAISGGAFAMAGAAGGVAPRLTGFVSRALIVLGRIGLGAFMIYGGLQHFLYGPFAARLVPAWIPGPLVWTYFAGAALMAGGIGLLVNPIVRLAAPLSGLMIGSWVFLLHLPRALAAVGEAAIRNEWTALFEAMAFSGTALVIAGFELEREPRRSRGSLARPTTP